MHTQLREHQLDVMARCSRPRLHEIECSHTGSEFVDLACDMRIVLPMHASGMVQSRELKQEIISWTS